MSWADLTDVRMYYEVEGEGPPLLLVPGLGTTSRLWTPVRETLAHHFTLIMIDNRGVGDSVAKRPPHSVADFSADIVELLDYLQLERTHVMGLSLGGMIAQRFAVDHPQRLDRLVLVSTTHRFVPYLRHMALLIGHALKHLPPNLFAWTMELLGSAPQYFDARSGCDPERIACISASQPGMMAQLVALQRSDSVAEDYLIQAPTLVVSGDHDAIIPSCYALDMANEIPGSVFHLVENTGHVPLVEAPERTLPPILAFLQEQTPQEDSEPDLQRIRAQAACAERPMLPDDQQAVTD